MEIAINVNTWNLQFKEQEKASHSNINKQS